MNNWFECRIKYDKTMDNGALQTVTESYIIDALSFTEAEARIVEEVKPFISGDFVVAGIKRKKYTEVIFDDAGDRYYNARLMFITLDEKGVNEKKTAINMLVQASDLKKAVETVEAEMKKTMIDYTIVGVTETAVMDLFMYTEKA